MLYTYAIHTVYIDEEFQGVTGDDDAVAQRLQQEAMEVCVCVVVCVVVYVVMMCIPGVVFSCCSL